MKLHVNFLKFLPLILLSSVASATMTWAPIACGCIPGWSIVAIEIGRSDIKNPDQLTARVIADGVAKTLYRKKVNMYDVPSTSRPECTESLAPTLTIRCTLWLWHSGKNKKGYDIVVNTTPDRVFKKVSVLPVTDIKTAARN